jgi:membrane protein implicated in regulation of membrane protease activity
MSGNFFGEVIENLWQFYLVAAMFFLLVAICFQRSWYLGLGLSFFLTAFLAMKITDVRGHLMCWLVLAFMLINYFVNRDDLLNPRLREKMMEEKLIGQWAYVVEEIDNSSRRGVVKVGKDVRTALSANGDYIPRGKRVQIQKFSGMRAVVGDP